MRLQEVRELKWESVNSLPTAQKVCITTELAVASSFSAGGHRFEANPSGRDTIAIWQMSNGSCDMSYDWQPRV